MYPAGYSGGQATPGGATDQFWLAARVGGTAPGLPAAVSMYVFITAIYKQTYLYTTSIDNIYTCSTVVHIL